MKTIYVELERFALDMGTKQRQIIDQIKNKYEKSEHFTKEEVAKLDTIL